MRKNLFARALALVMSLSLLSTSAFAHVVTIEGVDGTQDVDTVQAGVDMIAGSDSGTGSIQLTDIAEENVTIKDGANVTIDLNGNDIDGSKGTGSVIQVTGGSSLTLTDESATASGTVTGGTAEFGGGVKVANGSNFTMNGGTITGNTSTAEGGGVYVVNGSSFEMNGGEISDNTAKNSGGGVFIANYTTTLNLNEAPSKFVMNDGIISGNTAGDLENGKGNGGGVAAFGDKQDNLPDPVTINGGTIIGNKTGGNGAGIAIQNSGITMDGGIVSNNSGASFGGGIYIYDSTANISNATFTGNSTTTHKVDGRTDTASGGGLYARKDSTVNVSDSTFTNNSAVNGGGVYAFYNSTVNVADSVIMNNKATYGGGIAGFTSTINVSGSNIWKNTATTRGGGIYVQNTGTHLTLEDTSIKNNSAASGGGIYASDSASVTMDSGSITKNTATNGGGVRLFNGATFTMNDGSISQNTATDGGGVYSFSGNSGYNGTTFTMYGGEISGNTATSRGGGIFSYTATFNMNGGKLYNNTADNRGDDVYSNVTGGGSITLITAEDMGASISGETISRWLWDTSTARYKDGNYSIWSVDGETELCLTAAPAQYFTLTIDDGYSGNPQTTDLERSTEFPEIPNPVREGYTFIGWGMALPETVTGNITLVAQWEANVPEQPEQPDPDQPEQPEQPDPDQPEQPEQPDPDQPEQPEQPEQPDTPDTPDTPDQPDTPDTPEEPGVTIPDPDVPLGGAPEAVTTIEDEAVPLAGIVTLAELLEELRQYEEIDGIELPEDFKFIDHDYAQAIYWALAEGLVVDTEEEPLDPDEIVTVGLMQKVLDNFIANYKEFEDFAVTVEGEADEMVMDLGERLAAFYAELEQYEAE